MEDKAKAQEDLIEMKERYYNELNKKKLKSKKTGPLLTEASYHKLIDEVQRVKMIPKKKSKHYLLLNRYDVMVLGNKTKLIYPIKEGDHTIRHYVMDTEVFDKIHEAHLSTGHGKRDRMLKKLSVKYKNIRRPDVELYLYLCKLCEKKREEDLNRRRWQNIRKTPIEISNVHTQARSSRHREGLDFPNRNLNQPHGFQDMDGEIKNECIDISDTRTLVREYSPHDSTVATHTSSETPINTLELETTKTTTIEGVNDDYHFLMSLLPSLMSVEKQRKNIVRAKILQILCDENV